LQGASTAGSMSNCKADEATLVQSNSEVNLKRVGRQIRRLRRCKRPKLPKIFLKEKAKCPEITAGRMLLGVTKTVLG
jgi:hypothetical protein